MVFEYLIEIDNFVVMILLILIWYNVNLWKKKIYIYSMLIVIIEFFGWSLVFYFKKRFDIFFNKIIMLDYLILVLMLVI